jgi:hypothetical protein
MKKKYIHNFDDLFANNVCDIRGNKEYERFSGILDKLKTYDIIKSYKEFAEDINETSVGLNDIKKGRKKLSVNHVRNINTKYPFINTDFILFNEELPFYEDFLIAYYKENREYASYYEFDLEAIKSSRVDSKDAQEIKDQIHACQDNDLMKELLSTKNELLEAKDQIMKLQTEIYELKLKLSK